MSCLAKISLAALLLFNSALIATEEHVLLSASSSDEDIEAFFRSLPEYTIEKYLTFYFDPQNASNYHEFLMPKNPKELTKKIKKLINLTDRVCDVGILEFESSANVHDLVKLRLSETKRMIDSKQVKYATHPPFKKVDSKCCDFLISRNFNADEIIYRILSVFKFKITYKPLIDIEPNEINVNLLDKINSHKRLIFGFTRKYHKIFNALLNSSFDAFFNRCDLYSFLIDFNELYLNCSKINFVSNFFGERYLVEIYTFWDCCTNDKISCNIL